MPVLTAEKIIDQVIRGRNQLLFEPSTMRLMNTYGETVDLAGLNKTDLTEEILNRNFFPEVDLSAIERGAMYLDKTGKICLEIRDSWQKVKRYYKELKENAVLTSPMKQIWESFLADSIVGRMAEITVKGRQITYVSGSGRLSIFPRRFLQELQSAISESHYYWNSDSKKDEEIPDLSKFAKIKIEYEYDGNIVLSHTDEYSRGDYFYLTKKN